MTSAAVAPSPTSARSSKVLFVECVVNDRRFDSNILVGDVVDAKLCLARLVFDPLRQYGLAGWIFQEQIPQLKRRLEVVRAFAALVGIH